VECADTSAPEGYFSSKNNGPTEEALFQLDGFSLPGSFTLHIYVQDKAGGVSEKTVSITVQGS
jgi:hypothetical protein